MRVLISTPCCYGLATVDYVLSLIPAIAHMANDGHEVVVKMQKAESLINRGRNTDATYALLNGFDKILFIDADMIFNYEQIKLLLNSKRGIIGGAYPLKNFPITINFNPIDEHRDLFGQDRQAENFIAWSKKYADENGEAEVLHVPTGFLMVDTKVLADLTYKVKYYQNFNPDIKTHSTYYEFFPTHVVEREGGLPELLSEDWGFMELARKHGHKAYFQTKAITGHSGGWVFRMGQYEIINGQEPICPK